MIRLLKPLATRRNGILLLVLTALIPLPLAVSHILPDIRWSLLIPVTMFAALFAWALAGSRLKSGWIRISLFLYGPLVLLGRVAQIGNPLWRMLRAAAFLFPRLILQSFDGGIVDAGPFVTAQDEVRGRLFSLGHRLIASASNLGRGIPIGDPAVLALIWCLVLWMLAAWGAWQVRRRGRTLAGLLPATIALGVILDATTRRSDTLWLNLAALIFLFGLTNYDRLESLWMVQKVDYSESTRDESLIAACALALTLVMMASMSSNVSIKDMLDHLRESQRRHQGPTAQSVPANPGQTALPGGGAGRSGTLASDHVIQAGRHLPDTVFMLIQTGDLPPLSSARDIQAQRYYWRSMTYQRYTGSGWINPTETDIDVPPDRPLIQITPPDYRLVHQQVTFPNGGSGSLYWTGALVQTDTSMQVAWRSQASTRPGTAGSDPLQGADLVGALTATQSYEAESLLPQVSVDELRAAPDSYPDWLRARYLSLPDSVPERVRFLALDLTVNQSTPYDRAKAIETYLRKIPYSLDVPGPPQGRDAVDYFLFDLKEGYCDYYATAMTVLARAAGLPARFVIGYSSGAYDSSSGTYVVTESNSHAWTEIYFSGIGWVEFEPTAGQPALIRPETGSTLPSSLEGSSEQAQPQPNIFRSIFDSFPVPLAGLVLLLLALMLFARQALHPQSNNPTGVIRELYRQLRLLARPLTGMAPASETMHEYTHRLSGQLESLEAKDHWSNFLIGPAQAGIITLTQIHSRSLFASDPPKWADARRALQIWANISWRLWIVATSVRIRRSLSNK